MPGVPKSRGCDACRKQRKKCDQRQPSCSRCARLAIPCSGAGIQRYVFVDNSGPDGKTKQPLHSRIASKDTPPQIINSISPNRQDSITALMVNKLSVKDLRYDVGWAFGPFIAEIPRRLGRSAALDFAARTFVLSLPPSPCTRRHPRSDVLENFAAALKATRLALTHPVESKSIHTLCAAYMLMICQCQDRIGAPEDLGVHIVGINHLLNNSEGEFDPKSAFDATLVMILCSIMNAEKSLDQSLEASPSSPFWEFFNASKAAQLEVRGPNQKGKMDLTLCADLSRSLEGLSIFLHEIRPVSEALTHFAGVMSIIRQYRVLWQQSCRLLAVTAANPGSIATGNHSQEDLRAHLRSVRDYGASLTLGLVMNAIVQMYFPPQEHISCPKSQEFTSELITLAKQATHFKPFGAAFMSPFLHTIWAVGDHSSRAILASAVHLHGIDFDPKHATILSLRLNARLNTMRSRISATHSSNTTSSSPDPPSESTEEFQQRTEPEMPNHHIQWKSCQSATAAGRGAVAHGLSTVLDVRSN